MYCTKCGSEIPDQAKFCVKCGAKIVNMDPKKTGTGRGEDPSSKKTGTGQDPASKRTGNGGNRPVSQRPAGSSGNRKPQDNSRSRGEMTPEKNGNKKLLVLLIIAIFALAAAIGVMAYLNFGNKKKDLKQDTAETRVEKEAEEDDDEEEWETKDDSSSGGGFSFFHKDKDSTEPASEAADEDMNESAEALSETDDEGRKDTGNDTENAHADTDEPDDSATASEPVKIPETFEELLGAMQEFPGSKLTFMSGDVTDYPTVRLYYTYESEYGETITITDPVAGIKESVNGGEMIERKIKSIMQLEGRQGVSFDIVADKSGSMSSDMYQMQTIMKDFVSNMDFASGDAAELIAFDSFIMYMCTYTNDASFLRNGIDNMVADGETALYDALMEGIRNASYKPGARCVIGFTDGEDNSSVYTMNEVVNAAIDKEVPVYIIGLGGAGYQLSDMCYRTGGMYWNINDIGDMKQVMNTIYSTQKSMYCIEYESDKKADPYSEREVELVLTDEELKGCNTTIRFTASETIKQEKHESRYELVKEDLTWTQANDRAISKGGHLVTITSQQEQDQIAQMAQNSGLKYIWIGGYTSVKNSVAYGHWVTGEPFDYSAWYPGEPSRTDSLDGVPEFYLMLWTVDEGVWTWNDQRNDLSGMDWIVGKMGYIIEYEY